jgi:hypothetical protein
MWIKTQCGNLLNLDNVRTITTIGDGHKVYIVACSVGEDIDEMFDILDSGNDIECSPRLIAIIENATNKETEKYIDKLAEKLGAEVIEIE